MIYPRWFKDLSRADFLRSAGLYVTPDHLFLVRLRKNLFRVSVAQEESLEVALGQHPDSRRQALSDAFRSLLPHFNPAKDPFYVCLSADQVVGFQLFLPQVAEESLSQVVEYEIERQLPFRRDEIYYDYLPLGRQGDKVGIFLFAVPKKNLDAILDSLASLGVKPKGVETTATALANYLLFCADGITGTSLVVGEHNRAWEMIGLRLQANGWRESAGILFTHCLPQADWVGGPAREIFHGCVRESPRVFGWGHIGDFFQSMNQEPPQFQDLLTLGNEKLGGKKGLAHPFFLPAVGAALRGLREGTLQINLLPWGRQERRGRALYRMNVFLTVLLVVGLAAWVMSYPIKEELHLRGLQKENRKLDSSVQALRREEQELNRLQQEIASISRLAERRGEILQILDELSRVIPVTAYLSNLRYQGETVDLQGSAESASGLIPLLERSPLFENVKFNAPSNRGRDNRETFSLRAEIERPKGKEPKP